MGDGLNRNKEVNGTSDRQVWMSVGCKRERAGRMNELCGNKVMKADMTDKHGDLSNVETE